MPMPAGDGNQGRPPSSSYASLLDAVMLRRLLPENSRMIPRTIARITEKIGRELNSGAGPSEEAPAAGPILAESTMVALTVPISLWAGPSQGYRATPPQTDAIRYPRGQLN